jgi:hypothetical protein
MEINYWITGPNGVENTFRNTCTLLEQQWLPYMMLTGLCGVNVIFCVFRVHRELVHVYCVKTSILPAFIFPQLIIT